MIPADGNACTIGVILVGFEFAPNFFVGEFLASIGGDVLIIDDAEGFGTLDARACAGGRGSDALAKVANSIAVGLVPCTLELGMVE